MPNRAPVACDQPGCKDVALNRSRYCGVHQTKDSAANRERDSQRYYDNPWRKWYERNIWKKNIVPFVLARDPLCKICGREGSYVVDHIIDHMGDWNKFVDIDNCRGVCKPCHDKKPKPRYGKLPGGGSGLAQCGSEGNAPIFKSGNASAAALDKALETDEDFDDL